MRYSVIPDAENVDVYVVRTKDRLLGRLHLIRNKWAAFNKQNKYLGISGTDREAVAFSLYLEQTFGKESI